MPSENPAKPLPWRALAASVAESRDEDATLVALLLERNPAAASVLWARFAPIVRRILRRAVWPHGDVEDLLQDVFVILFRKLSTLRDPASLRPFIFSIASTVAASELRRMRVRRWLRLTPDGILPDQGGTSRDDDGREVLSKTYAVLNRVSDRDRMAFVLRTLEGFELLEVAGALDMSVSSVKRRVARVHERIEREIRRDAGLTAHIGLPVRESKDET
jgi:RNA polymerase sigma-70 factor, ECF subfamily